MSVVIEAEDLVKVYKGRKTEVRALDGLSLQAEEGRVMGLLGPNGAGKTTTVRILATLLRPDSGRATVAGYDVVRQAQQLRSVIGLSGQYAAVDENLTGREVKLVPPAAYFVSRPAPPVEARSTSSYGPTWSRSGPPDRGRSSSASTRSCRPGPRNAWCSPAMRPAGSTSASPSTSNSDPSTRRGAEPRPG